MTRTMTRTMTGMLVLAVMLSLTPGSSQAACAWVLWEKFYHMAVGNQAHSIGSQWQLHRVVATIQDCEGLLAARVRDLVAKTTPPYKTERQDINGTTGSVLLTTNAGFIRDDYDYLCLPDTMDPRKLPDPVWSKNSCGLALVVFQEPTEPFSTVN